MTWKPPPTDWTEERVTELLRRWNDGETGSHIAQVMGCSRNAVLGKVDRLRRAGAGVKRPKANPSDAWRGATKARVARMVMEKVVRLPKPPMVRRPPAKAWANPPKAEVDLSRAKPWTERAFGECAFIVSGVGADSVSCCHDVGTGSYCPAHHLMMFVKPFTKPAQLMRLARRAA